VVMKLLAAFLILTLALQPVQAGACAMGSDDGGHAAVHMDHGDSAMPDCCDPGTPDNHQGCDHYMQCGACSPGVGIYSTVVAVSSVWNFHFVDSLTAGSLTPSHAHPPYRPPIS